MKLGTKLILAFLACGLIPLLIVGVVSYRIADQGMQELEHQAGDEFESKAYNQLIALRDVKKGQIEQYFQERQGDLAVLVNVVETIQDQAYARLDAIQGLRRTRVEDLFEKLRKDATILAESLEIKNAFQGMKVYHDEKETGAKEPLDVSTPEYATLWEEHVPFLRSFVEEHGYYDGFIICAAHGHVILTVTKESDLGTNLVHGPYKTEGLAALRARVLESDTAVFSDFDSYTPSNGDQAAFVGAPLKDDEGKTVAIIALQLPAEPINAIVQGREGMGETGETYLVARDGKTAKSEFRSDMLTMGDGKYVIGAEISTEYIERCLDGEHVRDVFVDSKGNPVLIAGEPTKIDGLDWACITKLNLEEALSQKTENETEDLLTQFNNQYGYYDLFLINNNGYCFYTVAQEADYQTNLVDGTFKDSNLGKLTREVLASKKFAFADFEPYAPSNGDPASFIASPLLNEGDVDIIVALQMPLDTINRIMGVRAGMGESGETYLVGQDKLMRSDSFLDPTHHSVVASFRDPSKGKVDTEAANEALAGNSDAKIITDYNGNPVLSAYTPVDVLGARWALLAEIDESEAMATVKEMHELVSTEEKTLLSWTTLIGIIAAVLVTMVSLFIASSISKPINRIIADLTEGAEQVNDASGQVASASQQMAQGASEQASSLEETSSSLEEMASMTRTNAQSAKDANELAGQASAAADSGDKTMNRLKEAMTGINDSSDKISKIIKVIEEIAFQTNLLALNAAVEAARAGEHGKGFAVVAEEVRTLAQRAGQAARETTELIEESVGRAREGADVSNAVGESLAAIVKDVTRVSELISGIDQASKEQAEGVEQINLAVSQLDKVTQQNASGAEEAASAAEQLSAQSENVKNIVNNLSELIGGQRADATGSSFRAKSGISNRGKRSGLLSGILKRKSGDAQAEDAEYAASWENADS